MISLRTMIKISTGFLGIGFFVAFASSIQDVGFYSSPTLDEPSLNLNITVIEESETIPSRELPRIHRVEMDQDSLINGNWEVTRIINHKEETVYDIFNREEDKNSKIIVELELIEVSTVRIDGDQERMYQISLLTEANTIAFFKASGEGYEIIEARKIVAKIVEEVAEVPANEAADEVKEENPAKFHLEEEMILSGGVDAKRGNQKVNINQVEGTLSLEDDQISLSGVTFYQGTSLQIGPLDIEKVKIGDTGHFNVHSEYGLLDGVVSFEGKDKQRVKVIMASGPFAGARLDFVTAGKHSKLKDKSFSKERQTEDEDKEIEKVGFAL